jgi:hypothetical protein
MIQAALAVGKCSGEGHRQLSYTKQPQLSTLSMCMNVCYKHFVSSMR